MTGCDSRKFCALHRLLRSVRLLLLSMAAGLGAAEAPTLLHLFPVAAALGTSNTITFAGKFEPWPCKVWVDAAGIIFSPQKDKGKFSVDVATNAPIGPHLLRVYNDEGASAPRFFVVTKDREEMDAEPNDAFDKPQVLTTLPTVVNGRLDKSGDVDSFAVSLEEGQELVAWVEGYTLGSSFDGVLRLVDSSGTQVALNHDGVTFDPMLIWKASRKGTYALQLFGFAYPATSEVRFTGGEGCVYRLHVTTGPYVRYTLPLAVQRGVSTRLELHGSNLQRAGIKSSLDFDGAGLSADATSKWLAIQSDAVGYPIPVGAAVELMEVEPNDTPKEAMSLSLPSAVTGRIGKPGDEDFFGFEAKKQDIDELSLQSGSLGFPLDAWIKIVDAAGKELARTDDTAGSRDPHLSWTAPENGRYFVAVGDLTRKGGGEFWYHLRISRAEPAIRASVESSTFTARPGRTNEIKVALKRLNGHNGRIQARLAELPKGVEAAPVEVDAKSNEVTVTMIASKESPGWNGPIEILIRDLDKGVDQKALFSLVSTGENNGVPQGYTRLLINITDQLWLTVAPEPPSKEAEEAAKKE